MGIPWIQNPDETTDYGRSMKIHVLFSFLLLCCVVPVLNFCTFLSVTKITKYKNVFRAGWTMQVQLAVSKMQKNYLPNDM